MHLKTFSDISISIIGFLLVCCLACEDGEILFFEDMDELLSDYTVSHLKRCNINAFV
jgi:hypothetical protein